MTPFGEQGEHRERGVDSVLSVRFSVWEGPWSFLIFGKIFQQNVRTMFTTDVRDYL